MYMYCPVFGYVIKEFSALFLVISYKFTGISVIKVNNFGDETSMYF